MAAQSRILTIRVPVVDTTTFFQIQFAVGGTLVWTAYNPGGGADIAVAELDSSSDYTLDGVNGGGNSDEASLEGQWYQVRLKSGSLYGMWSPPFHVGAPTAADLEQRLAGMGITPGAVDLYGAAAYGLAALETATGRNFLPISETRSFGYPTAPSGVMDLGADFIGNPTALAVGGTAYVVGTGYQMVDVGAYSRQKPYWGVQFSRAWAAPLIWPTFGPISVTGLWGYWLTIPNDAWDAMLAASLSRLMPDLGTAATGTLRKWTEAEVSEEYGPEAYSAVIDRFDKLFDQTAVKYRRVTVGIGG